jgi:hypothetical protein
VKIKQDHGEWIHLDLTSDIVERVDNLANFSSSGLAVDPVAVLSESLDWLAELNVCLRGRSATASPESNQAYLSYNWDNLEDFWNQNGLFFSEMLNSVFENVGNMVQRRSYSLQSLSAPLNWYHDGKPHSKLMSLSFGVITQLSNSRVKSVSGGRTNGVGSMDDKLCCWGVQSLSPSAAISQLSQDAIMSIDHVALLVSNLPLRAPEMTSELAIESLRREISALLSICWKRTGLPRYAVETRRQLDEDHAR